MTADSQSGLPCQHHKALDRFDALGRLLMQFGPLVAGALIAVVSIRYVVNQIRYCNKKPASAGLVLWQQLVVACVFGQRGIARLNPFRGWVGVPPFCF